MEWYTDAEKCQLKITELEARPQYVAAIIAFGEGEELTPEQGKLMVQMGRFTNRATNEKDKDKGLRKQYAEVQHHYVAHVTTVATVKDVQQLVVGLELPEDAIRALERVMDLAEKGRERARARAKMLAMVSDKGPELGWPMCEKLELRSYVDNEEEDKAMRKAEKLVKAEKQSSWDIDVVKRVAKDTLGTKASSFSGSEPHRQLLWDSLVTALEASFVNKDSASEDIFDLVDVTKEVHPIFDDILLRALVSLTTPHSPARRWVDASARISPRDGKRALLEVTKRLLPPGHRPLRHHEELLGISFGSSDDPEPLVAQFDECLKAIAASGAGPLDDETAKRQLLAALDTDFYKEVITPLRLDTELAKVGIEEVYTHILEVWW
ncbi:hypothetical protein CYMTET_8849 [Cymbomonas tetramitiformis]|uniref:Uncharacterized protein n=1 Tax=Cymbomonas tetramitiformis TaxID=36881 RepID=A0AAE0GSP1_9CHLO|nr:hypothetical protein CYMTET_8849 [Cymbomonas tetramitiformis]